MRALVVVLVALLLAAPARADWSPVGGSVAPDAQESSLADVGGVPWLVATGYPDPTGSPAVLSRSWNGTTWVDRGILPGSAGGGGSPQVTDVAGVPYAVHVGPGTGTDQKVLVDRWDGMTWVQVGGALDTDIGYQARITAIGGVPYVAYVDTTAGFASFTAHVKRWDGSNWVSVGGTICTAGVNCYGIFIAGVGGVPTVAYTEDGSNGNRVSGVQQLSGTTWTPLGDGFAQGPAGFVNGLADDGGKPVVAFTGIDETNHRFFGATRWTGSAWAQLGDVFPFQASPSLAVVNGEPWLAFGGEDENDLSIRVDRWTGTEWTQVGSPVVAVGQAPSLTTVGGVAHASWFQPCSSCEIGYDVHVARYAAPGTLRMASATASVAEGAGGADIIVQREGDLAGTVSAGYATAAGSATAPADFTGASGTVTFGPGEAQETIHVAISDDALWEADETFTVGLSSPQGDVALGAPAVTTVTITDDDPPDTSITSGPEGPTNMAAPSFGFASGAPDATFECAIDDGAFAACSSPFAAPALPDGSHTFRVRAVRGELADPTPATRTFLVDTVAPVTAITVTPVDAVTARVDATATDAGSGVAAIGCVVDPPSPPAAVSGTCPLTVTGAGVRVGWAISRDAAGNVSTPVQKPFTLGGAPDTVITEGPSGPTWVTTPRFAFRASAAGATFRCRVDGAAFAACPSPVRTFALSPGAHVFAVAAVGADGQVDPTPATRAFTVNATIRMDPMLCTVDAFPSEGGRGCQFTGTELPFVNPDRCGHTEACTPVDFTCPAGALCENYTRVDWTSPDRNVWWRPSIRVENTGTSYSPFDYGCDANFTRHACGAWASLRVYAPTKLRSRCTASDASADHLPRPGDAAFGADTARQLKCTIIWIIEPAAVLDAVATLTNVQVNAPGPGTLTLTPAAPGRRLAVIARRKRRPPLFKKVRIAARRAGSAGAKLKLSTPARRKLRKRGRLPVRIQIRFAPADGAAPQTRVEKVTLTARPPTPPH